MGVREEKREKRVKEQPSNPKPYCNNTIVRDWEKDPACRR
jgi:hypothetical protein